MSPINGNIVADGAYQRPTNDDPVARGVHSPHAERFEPKEENWLLGNTPIEPPGVASIIADRLQTDSGAHEVQSVSHVERGSSLTNQAPVYGDDIKCYYCIASNIHAPHLHNVQLCTCAFRGAKSIEPSSTEPATVLNATSSSPRFDPSQLLRRSTRSSDNLVPVNGPGPLVAGGGASQARRNGINDLPLSCFSVAGTGAATYRRPSMPSPYASEHPQGAVSSSRQMARDDDPKGKRRAISTDDEGSQKSLSAAPSPSDLGFTASDTSSESDDDTVAGDVDDADDDQSSDTTAPSASVGTLDRPRKRRRRNSTVNNSRPRSAGNSRIHQRRRLERSMQRAGAVPPAPAQRASCACVLTLSSDETTDNNSRAVAHPPLPRETLEQSHQRVTAYLSSCFASNQRLRAELAEAREVTERLEEQLAEAEKAAFDYWERWITA